MAAWYPSLVVDFRLRFDEAFAGGNVPDPVAVADLAEEGRTAPASAQNLPLMLDGQADNLSYVLDRLPRSCSLELSSPRQASKFSITMDYRELPIDPRAIRACGVLIYLDAVAPGDFGEGMMRIDPNTHRRRSTLTPSEDNLRLVGVVDSWEVSHEQKGSTVTIEGRDARSLLIDSPIRAEMLDTLNLTSNIVDLVKEILSKHPFGANFQVQYNAAEWPDQEIPIISASDATPRQRHRRRATGRGHRASPQGQADRLSFWDVITRYCMLVGAVAFFKGQHLRIRPVRSLYDQQRRSGFDPANVPTPFVDGKVRTIDGGEELRIRRMVYGRDVAKISFNRKWGGKAAQTIEVVSYNPDAAERGAEARIITVRHPDTESGSTSEQVGRSRRSRVSPSGNSSSHDVHRISVPGVKSEAQLREIARSIYEELARGEIGGSVETKNLSSYGGNNADPDLLSLSPGDAIELTTDARELSDQAPLQAEAVEHERRSQEQEIQALQDRGIPQALANVIVQTSRGAIQRLTSFFYVSAVKFDWDSGSGLTITFDFLNYIEPRFAATPSVGSDNGSVQNQVAP